MPLDRHEGKHAHASIIMCSLFIHFFCFYQFLGSDVIAPKDLPPGLNGKYSTRAEVLKAEIEVLSALEWNLNLVTPAHFVCCLDAFDTTEEDLDLLAACMTSWVAAPQLIFKPSVWAAALTNHECLLAQCESSDVELARQTFHSACQLPKPQENP
jgi:hypothetical protein